jgi:CHAT domain-containing protein/predicted negative regulator of RcsB-dependent stress response
MRVLTSPKLVKSLLLYSLPHLTSGIVLVLGTTSLAPATAAMGSIPGSKLDAFHQTQLLTAATPATSHTSTNLLQRGKQAYDAGQFAQAVEWWQQAADSSQQAGDTRTQAISLNYLAIAHQDLGQWQAVQGSIDQDLTLVQSIDDPLLQAQVLNTLGSLQLHRGKAEIALTTWEQAAEIYQTLNQTQALLRSQINKAQALRSLGFYRRAQQILEQVNQDLVHQPDSRLKVQGLQSLGITLRVAGDLEESQQVLQEAVSLAEALQLIQDLPQLRLSLAQSEIDLNNPTTALALYQQVQATATDPRTQLEAALGEFNLRMDQGQETIINHQLPALKAQILDLPPSRWSSYGQINLATTLIDQDAIDPTLTTTTILPLLQQALTQGQILNDKRVQSHALGQLASFYRTQAQQAKALRFNQQALTLAQTVQAEDLIAKWQWQRGQILQAQLQTISQASKQTSELASEATSQKDSLKQAALKAYDEAVVTLGKLRQDLVANNPEVQFSFREQVEPVYREYVALLLRDLENLPTDVQQERLQRAREVIEALQLAELENFFREACETYQPRSIEAIDAKAAVIYTIVLDDRLEVILSLPGQPLRHYGTAADQDSQTQLLQEISLGLHPITESNEVILPAQRLYDWLLRPGADWLQDQEIETLVFVLDDFLRGIPMAVLHDGEDYLVEKYNLALTPGLQLLATVNPSPQEQRAFMGGLTEAHQGFNALPGVQRELDRVSGYLKHQTLINADFSRLQIQTQMVTNPYEVVHFATHGQFSSKAEETFLLVWNDRLKVKELDQLLGQQRDRRPIELLVLSACQTAAGDRRAALGLAGIAIRSGARSTLATLWSVEDQATADLVPEFYRYLVQEQLSKAEALRQAQLALLHSDQRQHPYYWAPFVMVGNWQ